MKNITGSIRVEKHHRKASILKSGSCRLHERPILIFSALFVLGIAAVHAQNIGQLGASAYPMSAPPAMTPAVAQTNALANPVVWQQYQEAAAKAAAAAYLQISMTNQASVFASANSSNLPNQIKIPTSGRISIQGNEAIGQGGPHTAEFAADLNSPVVVNLTMADGEQLQSHVLGLGYYTTDGQSVLIAGIKDSIGELLPPNQIIYRNAFDGVNADVVYTYTAYSVEQDIILRQQIPAPSQYKLDPTTTRLSVMTAFTKTPEPLQVPVQVDLSAFNQAAGVQAPASISDAQIVFKNMRMIQGRSFSLGDNTSAIPSSKSWLKIGSSHFLVESTPYALIEPLLSNLPPYTATIQQHKTQSLAAMLLDVPKPTFALKKHQIQLSRSEIKRPGVVLDYLIVSSPVLDINFGGYATNKVGFAATGQTTNDYWNGFNFGGKTSGTVYDLKWADQNYSGINVTVQNAPGWWANNTGDGMYDPYIYPWNGGNVTVTLSSVPAGTYDFYLYGHSVNACENSKFQITVGSNTTTWEQTQDSTFAGTSTNWTEGAQYVVFRSIAVSSGQSVIITCAPGDCGAAILNGLQMVSVVTGQPIIQAQPQSQCIWLGSNATLAVTAFGTTPLNYQWQHNGVNIAGATAATLNLTDVQFEDGGTYTVTVNNSFGSVTSAGAVLRVLSDSSALLNVDFTGSTQGKTGLAATGLATNDFWNEYRNTGNAGAITMTNLQWADGVTSSLSCISMTVSNAPGTWGNNTGDGMYDVYIYPWNGGNAVVTLANLPANTYDFYLYGHGNTPQSNAKFQLNVGNTTTAWTQTQDSTFAATSSNWVEGVQYVVFRNIAVAAGQAVTIACAPGDSGVAIFNGIQLLVSEPSDATDRDGDGLPDNWETGYFGYLTNQNASTLDGNGNTLLYDYQNGVNPTAITFSIQVTNNYANNMSVPAQLAVQGVPYYQAILVDDTNFAHAVWVPCTSNNPTINLGSTEGWHNVLIGLKAYCTDAYEVWQGKRLKLDLTPPWLTITNPVSDVISQPMIQLNGYSAEALGSIRYDITNATGLFTDQDVLVLNQFYDTNTWEFTTNTFQAFDIPLTNGLNIITVHATDLAGNTMTTNFNFTLDYSGKTNPPTIQLYWPQDGAAICGSSFTWRGWISDFTAAVTAQAVDSSGNTNIVEAVVERDGYFWVENLPLSSGSNLLTLTVTDAAGNVAMTNITVSTSDIGLTINPPDSSQFWNQSMTVYGSINSTDYTVWVNGVKATLNGTSWEADNVPNTPGGTAVFQARAIPNTDNGGNGTGGSGGNTASYDNTGNPPSAQAQDFESQAEKPSRFYVDSYHLTYTANNDNAYSDAYYPDGTLGGWLNESDDVEYSANWADQQGGNGGGYTETFDYKASPKTSEDRIGR